MRKIKFSKIVGSGNDFVVIDNRKFLIKERNKFAISVCDRKFGVGADGLLLLENSTDADFKMRIFNPDGSEPEMCGNGLRCIIKFAYDEGIKRKKKLTIETKSGILRGEIIGEEIKAELKIIGNYKLNIEVNLENKKIKGHFINTGVPHFVIITDNTDKIDIINDSRNIRYHKIFSPEGTNVDWITPENEKTIKIRTYERGVEDETLSCGTGSVASAIISYLLGYTKMPTKIIARSGEILTISFDKNFSEIYLQGKVITTFKGHYFEKLIGEKH
ncbi:MAG TPA: diaminopimelate epimerase [bacterium]|nr:diaminopimelate epimerase [bacterium]